MTISTRKTLHAFVSALVASGIAAAQTSQDSAAVYEPMFAPTGTFSPSAPPQLLGGLPPVIGQPTSVQLLAPGFDLGITVLSGDASSGLPMLVGGSQLSLYVDPLALVGTMVMPLGGGAGTAGFVVPPDPSLSGLDLALQAVVLNGSGAVAATNLLAANVGLQPFAGNAAFAFGFGPISIDRNSYYSVGGQRQAIANNATAAARNYTITGRRSQGGGTLEIRNQAGAVIATFGPNDTVISITITVPAGGKLYFYNSSGSSNVNGVTWTIESN